MPEAGERTTLGRDDVRVSFADESPYLMANSASLDDLNDRIDGSRVAMEAFRPNLVVDGQTAWVEDTWDVLQVGEARFEMLHPCRRCSMTTLDPERPDRPRADGEPLRTLASFRRNAAGKVLFGVYAVCLNPGAAVHVGDEVRVERFRS